MFETHRKIGSYVNSETESVSLVSFFPPFAEEETGGHPTKALNVKTRAAGRNSPNSPEVLNSLKECELVGEFPGSAERHGGGCPLPARFFNGGLGEGRCPGGDLIRQLDRGQGEFCHDRQAA